MRPSQISSGPNFDYGKLSQEAKIRWLKPSEVFLILQNHSSLPIEQDAPEKPPSGSLFLFDRRVLRFFRKDGHLWRKKKDGKTVGEAHERLKVGNVDALSCYYAHGEQNPYFQRRSYWMLDPAFDHIVFVHYREVLEGRFLRPASSQQTQDQSPSLNFNLSASSIQFHDPSVIGKLFDSRQSSCSSFSGEVNSKYAVRNHGFDCMNIINSSENSDLSSQSEVSQALRDLEEQLNLDKCDNNLLEYLVPARTDDYERIGGPAFIKNEKGGFQRVNANLIPVECSEYVQGINIKQEHQSLALCHEISRKNSPSWNDMLELSSQSNAAETHNCGGNALKHASTELKEHMATGNDLSSQLLATKRFLLGSDSLESPNAFARLIEDELANIVESNSKMANIQKENIMRLDQTQHEASLSAARELTLTPKKLFKIREISPEWCFSFERTKVLIAGDFFCDSSSDSWAVMFDGIEVPAEIVQQGVLRCRAPQHAAGTVALFILSKNNDSCSEISKFEYRIEPNSISMAYKTSEELLLFVKFAHFLLRRHETAFQTEEQWIQIIDRLKDGCELSSLGGIDWVLQELLKDKFQHWLPPKIRTDKDRNSSLSKEEQGVIHLISGLGYEWALNSILDIGVGVNFRDTNGWTALHWAARFGREKMVAALLAAGALAGAVTDPTPRDPVGKTAGAIAAASGHKGLAGYLSEADLTSHLSSLTMEECEISKRSAAVDAEMAVQSVSARTPQVHGDNEEDDLTLKDSLSAVRNAAQAAARIQAAFRALSFRKRREKAAHDRDEYGMTNEDIYDLTSLTKNQRADHSFNGQKIYKAALSIQKKYRGWKGRKKFLDLKRHAVKIQAHVRGHQTRKKYRELLWTVGVLEKVVLRWRRRGAGLRGFRPEPIFVEDGQDDDEVDIAKLFRKQKVDEAMEEAFARVLSMVESPTARRQYRRMLERYHETKAERGSAEKASLQLQEDLNLMEDDDFLHWLR